MDVSCSAEPCPVILNSTCVFYEGENLIYTGINTNDTLQTALQKIDAKFEDAGLGYIFQNGIIQSAPGQPVKLGGSLTQNTVILSNGYTFKISDSIESAALITTGGTSSQFVKGDGSLDSTSYQPSGSYITALTGDVTANGPGSANATLATVFGAPGTYGNSGTIPRITVDGKGRVTNVTPVAISYPAQSLSFVGDVSGFGFTGSPVTLTLDTVNTDVYGSNNFLKFAVNGKGLITSATPVSGGDITTTLGYVPVDDAIQLSINGVSQNLTANRSWSVGTVTSVGVVPGTGISASVSNPNTTPSISIVNTAPDQIVVLNSGYGISVTGSYPNFTITNDYPDLPNEGVTNFSAGNLSPLFNTSVTNPTTTPDLTFALSNASANTVFAGPDGIAGAPTYRALVAADIPSLSYLSNISTTAPLATTGGLTPTLSISQAGSTTDGYLSTTDWNTFNNKQNALGFTPVPDTRELSINGVDYDLTANRCWSVGTVTSITASAPLTGGTITGSGSVGITQAGAGSDGYLSSTDWNTFDGKQPAGNYITALTGDGTASGPGSAGLTLATVNATTGTFGSSTQVPVITVNNKGLITCVTTDTISGSLEFIGDVTGVGSTGTCTSLTLATVNNDVYTSETLLNIAVNGKGLITSANPTTSGDICSTLGYTPENVANKSTCTSLGVSNTLYPTQLAVKTYVDNATAGGIILQGNWNAATNTPDITGTTTTGWAWRVDVAGTTNLGGITDWQVGDLAVKSATGWVKIDNTENVTSVFGRFGAIVATTGDYLSCQVTECGNLYYTDARVRAAVGHTAPLTYCSTTGVFGITQSNTTTDGYLSATDWNTFNDKQPLIAAGTIGQYYRGDKTFQTLDTSVVTEGTNLYFTDARARNAICASSGVAYNSTTGLITNSCPDQIVSLTGGGTTSITGTYPNFCITSSDSFTGTVTCVAVSGTNIGVTGSPITSAGTIGLSLSGANVCNALGYTPYNATNPAGYTTCTGTVTSVATSTSTTGVLLSGSPITSSGTLGINISTASTVCTGLLTAADWNTFNSHTSCTGTVTSVGLTSSTTGVSIGGSPITSSGNLSLNIATASATCTGLLTAADWNTFNSHTGCTGTVTSVNATGTNISVTGGPITTSGSLAISLSGANVCSALGYTPYNATNPNGYTTCIGTVTSAGIVATNINVCNSPVTTSGNICLNLTAANVCSALGFSPAPSSALSSYLPLSGGTLTGPITIGTTVNSVIWNDGTGTYMENTGNTSASRVIRLQAHNGSFSYTQLFVNGGGGYVEVNNQMRSPQFRFTNSGNSAYFTGDASWGARIYTDSGYIWFGPANSGHAHIYTDRPNFYFNADILINGTAVVKNDGGTWNINISGNAATATSASSATTTTFVASPDGSRNPNTFALPTSNPRSVRYDFSGAGFITGATGNYAGVMTYAPWDGTSASTGDSSYQLAFCNWSGVNASGLPGLALRNGINSSWNSTWYQVLHSGNLTSYALPVNGNWIGNTGMNDQRLFLRTNGDLNHYLWNAADDWEELNAYEGTGFRITSNMGSTGVLYVYGSSNGGYTYSPYSFRAPIFYDSQDTAYYVDPNGTSNLLKLSGRTMAYNDMNPMSANSPYAARYNGSAQYRNGTMGYGTTDFNVILSNWGSGFIDTWSSPGNAPGGSSHYVGLQGFHYNFENNSQAYGFQMACAGEADNRFFWRSAWPNVRSWVEMIHSGNIGSQTVSKLNPLSGDSNYKLAYTADGARNNAGEWGRAVMYYVPNGQTYGIRVDRADYADSAGSANSVAWTNVSGRPTTTSAFTNDSGYITSASNVVGLYSSGFGSGNFTWYQSPGGLAPYTGSWASFLISNHGDGATYYNQTIIMPFWGPPQYMRKEGGTNRGPYTFWTTENLDPYNLGSSLSVSGSVTATGFYESSDSRLKELIQDDYRAVGIQNIKPKLYIKDGKEEVGYYAQDLQSILSSAVTETNEGFLNLSYTQVHTAKIAYIEDEVDVLKRRVAELEVKLQKYEA